MIPLAKPFFDKEELEAIKETLDSGWVAGQGPKNKKLANKLADYLGVKYAIPVVNCTAALHLAMLALGIGPGDEVIVPDFTYPASAHGVLYVGATPVFADVDIRTYNLDPELIKSKITSKTKAILPVHTFGLCSNMDKIKEIARENNLLIIEDAACAFGSKQNNKPAGTFGDVSCFSFHAKKNITSGEGGLVVTNNKEYAERIQSLMYFGIESAYDRKDEFQIPVFKELGYNYKLSDIAAAVLLKQIEKSQELINKKIENAKYYNELLKNETFIQIPESPEGSLHTYQAYMVLLDDKIDRNKVIQNLLKKGIQTNIGTYAIHQQPLYKKYTENVAYPNSLKLFNQGLALPMFYSMTKEQIKNVVDELKNEIKQQDI